MTVLSMLEASLAGDDAGLPRRTPAAQQGDVLPGRPANGGGDRGGDASRPKDRHGWRVRAMIVVLWRAGLRVQEALALAEHDLDHRRGSLLIRNGKGGRRREVGMDEWGWEQLGRGWVQGQSSRSGRCSASLTAPPAGDRGQAPRSARSSAGSPPARESGVGSRRTSSATLTRSSPPARASRSTSSSVSSATPTSAPRRSICKGLTPERSSPPSGRAARQ